MKLKLLAISLLVVFILTACNDGNTEKTIISDTQNIREVVQKYSANQATDESAKITAQELIVTDSDGNETVYSLSGEDFFVSIAPYMNETHP